MQGQKEIRTLVVDDESSLREVIAQVLREDGFTVDQAENGEQALKCFGTGGYQLVIADIKMPGMSGIELLQEIKRRRAETEVIIITSHASLDSAVTALRNGAYDYLIKPFDDIALISAVTKRAVDKILLASENRQLVDELKTKNDELGSANRTLKDLAIRDGLTGIFNHRYFQEALSLELVRSERYKHRFSIILLDVDHFKHFNDTNGHPAGDRILREIADLIGSRLRRSDILARYGGEEFVLILPETTHEMAMKVAEGVRRAVEEQAFEGREKQPGGKVTVSLGVASFPDHGKDGSSLIEHADKSLYASKHGGRNRVN